MVVPTFTKDVIRGFNGLTNMIKLHIFLTLCACIEDSFWFLQASTLPELKAKKVQQKSFKVEKNLNGRNGAAERKSDKTAAFCSLKTGKKIYDWHLKMPLASGPSNTTEAAEANHQINQILVQDV